MNQIGIIGLGTMGASLARNFASRKVKTAVFNRTTEITDVFISEYSNEGPLTAYSEISEFVNSLESPRKIILMVTAGQGVDAVIDQLQPLLSPDDIIIDGGNSNYKDTIRRTENMKQHNLHFIGCGISGGEKGALEGPSLMPGGSIKALKEIMPLLELIAAKDFNQNPCVSPFIGAGAGHFIKTVHNGIEYAIMQNFADAYELLRKTYQLKPDGIAKIFKSWQDSQFNGFLLETAIQVLEKPDTFNSNESLIDFVSDEAGAKGTGAWTAQVALDYGIPVPTILAALTARQLSAQPEVRQAKQSLFTRPNPASLEKLPLDLFVSKLEQSLWISILASYLQGIHLLDTVIAQNNWKATTANYLRVWQGGCIIRSEMLKILPTADHFDKIEPKIDPCLNSLREILHHSTNFGISIPALSASFDYFNYQMTANLPTNLIQGMRDCFGAHTYHRTDKEGSFTENW